MDKRLNIIHGDALVELKKIKSETVDLIVTDPPYNLNKNYGITKDSYDFDEYLNFTRAWLKESIRILKPNGTIYIFMGMRYISIIWVFF